MVLPGYISNRQERLTIFICLLPILRITCKLFSTAGLSSITVLSSVTLNDTMLLGKAYVTEKYLLLRMNPSILCQSLNKGTSYIWIHLGKKPHSWYTIWGLSHTFEELFILEFSFYFYCPPSVPPSLSLPVYTARHIPSNSHESKIHTRYPEETLNKTWIPSASKNMNLSNF